MKNFKMKAVLAGAVATPLLMAGQSFAALDSADLALIKSGVEGSDANYFIIGGAILVVMAGIWGFKKIRSLIS